MNLAVNRYVEYRADPPGMDFWQTAEETASLGTGDCEDYAILKAKLVNGPSRLHIVYADSSDHAILEVLAQGRSWYMDNRFDHILSETEKQLIYGPSTLSLPFTGIPEFKRRVGPEK